MMPIDWNVATNSSGIRATRARESCARYTAAIDGHSRARGRVRPVPARSPHGQDAARHDFGGYDTHVVLLPFVRRFARDHCGPVPYGCGGPRAHAFTSPCRTAPPSAR
ncbi:hypothetical protein SHKM778_70850 [Streptomyces sp. KM77-8]|uniref:Uncharacterized protein n=1 Tax=Streptomyces haneummycinicus TaxID=3074435 RepID=A0AAT9HTK2_9ACTN